MAKSKTVKKKDAIQLLHERGRMTNSLLRELLSLEQDKEKYESLKNELLKEKLISKYRCRGGGVMLTNRGEKEAQIASISKTKNVVKKESELYVPLKDSLESVAEQDQENCFVEITGTSVHTGKWSNPDLVKVTLEHYKHLKKKQVLVTTYEVKKFNSLNVDAIFEALAHARFAHYVYVVAEVDNSQSKPPIDIEAICQTHGVGFITMWKHYSHYRHSMRIQPRMQPALDDDIEDYLERLLSRSQSIAEKFQELDND